MVQHAGRLDDIEPAARRRDLEQVALRAAYARLARERSIASTRARGKRRAVSIACWPVPQPAISKSIAPPSSASGLNETPGNCACIQASNVRAASTGAAFVQRGYGCSSYCCRTRCDVASEIAVSAGSAAAMRASSSGSATTCCSIAATGADQGRSSKRPACGSVASGT